MRPLNWSISNDGFATMVLTPRFESTVKHPHPKGCELATAYLSRVLFD